jgi:hypothetical protein
MKNIGGSRQQQQQQQQQELQLSPSTEKVRTFDPLEFCFGYSRL